MSLLNTHDNEVRVTLNTTVKEPGQAAPKKADARSAFVAPPDVGKVPAGMQGSFFEKLIQQQKEKVRPNR